MDKKEQKEFYKEKFVKELTKLSEKYKVYIGGCGCCGSPYLISEIGEHNAGGELSWDVEKKAYIDSNKSKL